MPDTDAADELDDLVLPTLLDGKQVEVPPGQMLLGRSFDG